MGWVVVPNIAIHGGFSHALAFGLKPKGEEKGLEKTDFAYSVATLGLTYYFMPFNIYVSPEARFVVTRTSQETEAIGGGLPPNSNLTYSARNLDSLEHLSHSLSIGKEWFLSDNYAMGVALTYSKDFLKGPGKVYNPSASVEERFKSEALVTQIGLALSITIN